MLADYHIHTARCGHASGEMGQYVKRAEETGLGEIGFADHLPLLHSVDPHLTMSRDELPLYLEEVARAAAGAAIPVRLGIEADYVVESVDELATILGAHSFDYVLGSVHFVDGWAFDDPRHIAGYEGRDHEELYEGYFGAAIEAVRTGLFDVLAHPDLIKKFGILPAIDLSDHYAQLADAVARQDMAVEVSTAGLRKPIGEIYPTEEFLAACLARGIPVTLGSDAHRPEEVGYRFGDAVDLLRRVGYTEISVLRSRKRSPVSLDERP